MIDQSSKQNRGTAPARYLAANRTLPKHDRERALWLKGIRPLVAELGITWFRQNRPYSALLEVSAADLPALFVRLEAEVIAKAAAAA